MKKSLAVATAAVLALSAFVGVTPASAATEFGSACTGEEAAPFTLVSIGHGAGSPLPATSPISGVVTEWKVNTKFEVEGEEAMFFNALVRPNLQVWRSVGGLSYTLISEAPSTGQFNLDGTNAYPSRIPIAAGDHLGLGGGGFVPYCEGNDPADTFAYSQKPGPVGSTTTFEKEVNEDQIPVVARVEPDVDGDGYGDETQDKCPQSAAYQTPCPVVTIGSLPIAGAKAVTLYVSTSLAAPVGVTGTVPLGKGKTASLTATAQTVAPGSLAPFTLTLTPEVTKALKKLPKKQSLTMTLIASATNVTGTPSTSATTVKLKGQMKPVHKKKSKGPNTK